VKRCLPHPKPLPHKEGGANKLAFSLPSWWGKGRGWGERSFSNGLSTSFTLDHDRQAVLVQNPTPKYGRVADLLAFKGVSHTSPPAAIKGF